MGDQSTSRGRCLPLGEAHRFWACRWRDHWLCVGKRAFLTLFGVVGSLKRLGLASSSLFETFNRCLPCFQSFSLFLCVWPISSPQIPYAQTRDVGLLLLLLISAVTELTCFRSSAISGVLKLRRLPSFVFERRSCRPHFPSLPCHLDCSPALFLFVFNLFPFM